MHTILIHVIQTIAAEAVVVGAHGYYFEKLVKQIEKSESTAGPQLFAPVLSRLIGPVGLVTAVLFFAIVFFQPPSPGPLFRIVAGVDASIFMCLCFGIWAAIADHACGPTKKQLEARARRGSSWIPRTELPEANTVTTGKVTRQRGTAASKA